MTVSLDLPAEFVDLCQRDRVEPAVVLRGFIADLCGQLNYAASPRPDGYWRLLNAKGYISTGGSQRWAAQEYYESCGYA